VIIRQAAEQDWPLIYPIYAAIMAEGKTYPFPERQSLDEARPWWMEQPPGQTVVAVSDGVIVGSAKMGATRPGRGSHVATASFLVDPAPAVHLWQSLGFQIIGTVPASFDHPEHGLVGLHVMFRHL
jgi:L-amino acid N-acyltransferase YncA